MWCGAVLCCAVLCGGEQCGAMWCGVVLCCAVWWGVVCGEEKPQKEHQVAVSIYVYTRSMGAMYTMNGYNAASAHTSNTYVYRHIIDT